MSFTDQDRQAMDDAAVEAENELNAGDYPDEVVLPVARWMQKWFPKAGYKRLGRILVGIAEEHQPKEAEPKPPK